MPGSQSKITALDNSDNSESESSSDSELENVEELGGRRRKAPKKFRLLIIGKTGCGKTTILSKVCGEDVADKPSTTRGTHDIEREMEFKNNKQLVVHDSEGFESGKPDEYNVVSNFIRSRGRSRNIRDRLHAIWYCLTSNSRPIQAAEETFFSEKHDVPVIAIFTKFEIFVESQLQELMDGLNDIGEEKEEELEKQAEKVATEKFNKYFKGVLMKKPFPPQAEVVALSDVEHSTPEDPRLGELIRATMAAISADSKGGTSKEQKDSKRLAALFAAAQKADLTEKYRWSIEHGTPEILTSMVTRSQCSESRAKILHVWQLGLPRNTFLALFKNEIEDYPQTFGNSLGQTHRNGNRLTSLELEAYRCLQLASDLSVIATELFLLKTSDVPTMMEVVKKYPSTPAFSYIQEHILEDVDIGPTQSHIRQGFRLYLRDYATAKLIDKAVRSYLWRTP